MRNMHVVVRDVMTKSAADAGDSDVGSGTIDVGAEQVT